MKTTGVVVTYAKGSCGSLFLRSFVVTTPWLLSSYKSVSVFDSVDLRITLMNVRLYFNFASSSYFRSEIQG